MHVLRYVGAAAVALAIAAIAVLIGFSNGPLGSGAPAALADVGDPTTIDVSSTGSTVTASGTWFWVKIKGNDIGDPACELNGKAVGFAVDWDDGSPLEMKWAGPDPATPVALDTKQPDDNCGNGDNGPWGGDSHTYTSPGTFNVCVVIYDIHVDSDTGLPETETGMHSIDPVTNTDNNVERNETDALCAEITLELTITLDPPTATNTVGEDHEVTATVGIEGTPVGEEFAEVEFEITDGPNKGDTGTDSTDADGEATFTYTGDGGVGDDTIEACVVDFPEVCDTATKTWEAVVLAAVATPTPTPTPVALPASGGTPSDGGSSALPWLAAIAGAIALIGSGSAWFAYQRRRVR